MSTWWIETCFCLKDAYCSPSWGDDPIWVSVFQLCWSHQLDIHKLLCVAWFIHICCKWTSKRPLYLQWFMYNAYTTHTNPKQKLLCIYIWIDFNTSQRATTWHHVWPGGELFNAIRALGILNGSQARSGFCRNRFWVVKPRYFLASGVCKNIQLFILQGEIVQRSFGFKIYLTCLQICLNIIRSQYFCKKIKFS